MLQRNSRLQLPTDAPWFGAWNLELGIWNLKSETHPALDNPSANCQILPLRTSLSTNSTTSFMSFVWNAYQQGQISEAKTDAIKAQIQVEQSSIRVVDL